MVVAEAHEERYMGVYVVGDDRLELLAVVDVRRDPAWIEATIATRAEA